MALLHIITFLIHAIAAAFASTMGAVITHLLPAFLLLVACGVAVAMLCASCGVGGVMLVRKRRQRD